MSFLHRAKKVFLSQNITINKRKKEDFCEKKDIKMCFFLQKYERKTYINKNK